MIKIVLVVLWIFSNHIRGTLPIRQEAIMTSDDSAGRRSYGTAVNIRIETLKDFLVDNGVENSTVYLGLANNPFGPSKRLTASSSEFNSTTGKARPQHQQQVLHDGKPTYFFRKRDSMRKKKENRSKRGVIHLYNMVSCATGCNPLIYKGYGCYCGFLGSGYAVDGIDRCCKRHDWCYDSTNCPMFLEYFVPYYWTCFNNRPICAIEHGEYGGYGSCAQRLCECDRVLSECLSKYPCPGSRALCKSSPWRLLQNALMLF